LGWGVLLTQPNRWRTAQEHAAQQGFDTWFPRTSKTELLFPRYGFVRIVAQWLALLATRGVSDVLRSGDEPMYVPEAGERGMAALRARERGGVIVLPPRQRFASGEPVRVDADGLYFGALALYEGMPQEGRARVLLSMLGKPTRLDLDDEALSPA